MEKDVEKYLGKRMKELRAICWKFVSPGLVGVPDRMIVHKGEVIFIELKNGSEGSLSKMQRVRHKELKDAGATVMIIRDKAEVDILAEKMKEII